MHMYNKIVEDAQAYTVIANNLSFSFNKYYNIK